MTAEIKLYRLIDDVVDSGLTDLDDITREVFNRIGLPKSFQGWFRGLLRDAVRRHLRRQVTEGYRARTVMASNIANGNPNRPAFLSDTIETFGPWGRVAYGAMTIEMHKSRINGQKKLRAGVNRDITKHEEAIRQIRAAGVMCLNDKYVKKQSA